MNSCFEGLEGRMGLNSEGAYSLAWFHKIVKFHHISGPVSPLDRIFSGLHTVVAYLTAVLFER